MGVYPFKPESVRQRPDSNPGSDRLGNAAGGSLGKTASDEQHPETWKLNKPKVVSLNPDLPDKTGPYQEISKILTVSDN